MYWLNLKALSHDLHNDKVTSLDTLIYAIAGCFIVIFNGTVMTFLPYVYRHVFTVIKLYLEEKAHPTTLTIQVFEQSRYIFDSIFLLCLIMGTLVCYQINYSHDNKYFLKRFIALSVVTNIRIIILTGVIALIMLFITGGIFTSKLMPLVQDSHSITNTLKKCLFIGLQQSELFNPIAQELQNHNEAKVIFDEITTVSFIAYWLAYVGALFSTVWFFITIQRTIKKIARDL